MAETIRSKKINQQENTLQVEFSVNYDNIVNNTTSSPQYCICGLAQFQLRCDLTRIYSSSTYKMDVLIKFLTLHPDEDLVYYIKLSSNVFKLKNKMFLNDDTDWRLINSSSSASIYTIDISVVMDVVTRPSFFKPLAEEDKSTDFQLRGKDGSVDVHRYVLSAYSPVLRAMLDGEWRERSEGVAQIKASKETLENLRDYMYTQKLPAEGLEPLLSLASAYMMTELMKLCSVKLLFKLNDDNHVELMELATKYRLKTLFLGIQESVKHGLVKPKATLKYFDINKWV